MSYGTLLEEFDRGSDPFLRCPSTRKDLRHSAPMLPGVLIVDWTFVCPHCGDKHVANYPPPTVAPLT